MTLRALLHQYPRAFRSAFSADVWATYLAARLDCPNGRARFHLWRRPALSLITNGVAERAHRRGSHNDRSDRSEPSRENLVFGGWSADVRLAFRSIRRTPLFSAVVVLTLALAIGGVTAVFTLVDPILLRPLPYQDADRIVRGFTSGGGTDGSFQYADFLRAGEAHIFERLGTALGPTVIGRVRAEDTDYLFGCAITSDFLAVLGVSPAIGREFTRAEYAAAASSAPNARPLVFAPDAHARSAPP